MYRHIKRNTQVQFAFRILKKDPSTLMSSLFRNIDIAHDLNAAGQSGAILFGKIVEMYQHAILAKTNAQLIIGRFNMDVAGISLYRRKMILLTIFTATLSNEDTVSSFLFPRLTHSITNSIEALQVTARRRLWPYTCLAASRSCWL